MKMFYKPLLKFFIYLHNQSYQIISALAVKIENKHPKHRLIKYHQFFLDHIRSEDRILDLGCGKGELAFDLAQKAKFVLALDNDKKQIASAQKKYPRKNLKYELGDIAQCAFPQKFDLIILSNILEHLEKRVLFLKKIKKIAPKILIRAPLLNRDWLTLYKKELNCKWQLDQSHQIEYTAASFKKELHKANLNLIKYSIQFGEIWAVVSS